MGAMYKGLIASAVVAGIAFYPVTTYMLGDTIQVAGSELATINLYYAALIRFSPNGCDGCYY